MYKIKSSPSNINMKSPINIIATITTLDFISRSVIDWSHSIHCKVASWVAPCNAFQRLNCRKVDCPRPSRAMEAMHTATVTEGGRDCALAYWEFSNYSNEEVSIVVVGVSPACQPRN